MIEILFAENGYTWSATGVSWNGVPAFVELREKLSKNVEFGEILKIRGKGVNIAFYFILIS